jgi:signal transduction histidine kinase
MPLRQKGLGFRLLSAFIIIIVIVLTVQTLFAILREGRKVRDELANKGALLTNLLSYSARVAVFAENKTLLEDLAAGVVAEQAVMLVGIYNADMKQLYVVNKAAMNQDVIAEAISKPGATMTTRETGNMMEFTKPVVIKQFPNEEKSLYFDDEPAYPAPRIIGYVRIVLSKDSLNREIRNILALNAFIALLFIGASVGVIYFTVKTITRPLETLTRHVRVLGKGGDVEQVPIETMDEIGRLATAFNTMLDERNAARAAFQKILMDIHDGIGGITTNISLLAEIAQKADKPEELKKSLGMISELSRDGMSEIRSLMYSLDKKDLTWNTLIAELRNRGTRTVEPHRISFEMAAHIEPTGREPGTLLCLHLFRIYRESLTNVIKHSKAKKVIVSLRVVPERLVLEVRDDGMGYDLSVARGKGRGITNMRTRAAEIGGVVTINTTAGTCVSVEIPLSVVEQ